MWTVSLRRLTTTTGLCSGKLVQKAIHTSKPVPYVASSSGFLPQLRHHSSTPESSLPPVIGAYPLQQESAQDAPIATGYNLLLQRIANMIVNITEKHVAKVLHIHPESASALQAYLGKISHVELNGFSTATEAHRDFPLKNRYNQIEYDQTAIGDITKLPFRSAAFDVVIQCLPILHPEEPSLEGNDQKEMMLISPPSLPLPELLRLVNHKGFFIVGFPAVLWDKYEIQSLVDHISSSNSGNIPGEWLVMQRITLPLKDVKVFQDGHDDVVVNDWQAFDSPVVMMSKRNGPPVRKNSTNVFSNSSSDSSVNSNKSNGSSSSQVVNNEKEVAIEYCLALFRKK